MTATRDNIPPSTTIGITLTKTFIGLVLGAILGFAFFLLLTIVGDSASTMISGDAIGGWSSNPLIAILLLIVTLISTFVGMAILIATYSMLYGDEYYDFGSMFRYIIMTNVVIFIFLVPVYLFFMGDLGSLFFIMALHVAIAVYVWSMQLEMMVNPHYAISASIGATFGLVLAMMVYGVIIAAVSQSPVQDNLHWYIILPPILMYGLIPLGIGLWRSIYTKMYESGSDSLYLASPSELAQQASTQESIEDDEINVEM